ncbi:MAG: oligoendopeptidase F [Deltaproteobacteria bacterium]|nr:oligoendopeptidase F [Deltaproteobacteria bacterium]
MRCAPWSLLVISLSSAVGAEGRAASKDPVPDANAARSSIPEAYKWKLAPLFKDDAAFERELTRVTTERRQLSRYAGTLKTPKALRECLELYFSVRLSTNKLTLYANMRFDSDQTDTKLQAMRDKSLQALNALMTDAGFIRREVLSLDDAVMQAAFAAEPKLSTYKPYLEEMRRRRARVLSADAERVLALAGDNLWAEIDLNEIPSDFEKTFKSLLADVPLPTIKDEDGREVQLTLASYPKYRGSRVRDVRRAAVEGLFATLKQYRHTFAGTMAGQVNQNVMFARARGYDSALAAYLDKDNIDPVVYRSLIDAVHANLAPLHDYVALRKEVMGLKELHIYDLYTPLVPQVAMTFTYSEARALLPKALAVLGPNYLESLRQGLEPKNGWVDVYPNKDKESGAFSSSVYGVHPFVKLNYFNEYDDLSTMAHEFGHAMHSSLAMATQPYVTFNYATFIAEIASTFNEKVLSDYLVKNAKNDDERLFILNHLLESIRTTIYRQALFAELELAMHTAAEAGTPLTAELLCDTYKALLGRYYGPGFAIGDNDDIEWAYIPHFYYKYYMYAYALGLSSGIALAELVQTGDPARRDAYLNMLKGGSSKAPLALLKDGGVDLSKPTAVEAAARLMQRTLDEMRTILARRTHK